MDHPGSDLNIFAIFSGHNKYIDDPEFKGGSISCTFGGAEIDLTNAELATEGAVLDLSALFGGMEISVPKHWKIQITGTPIFGGLEDKTVQDTPNENTRTLHIYAHVIFGGIEINNYSKHRR